MIEFGKSLREAREAKGLTIRQLAEITRLAPTTIQELESENFSRIAAPIYGRGFVKLYCNAVGLAPEAFVEEFMNLYTGNHESPIRERTAKEQPPSAPAQEPVLETEVADDVPPCSSTPVSAPLSSPVPEPRPAPDLFQQEPEPESEPVLVPEPAPAQISEPKTTPESEFEASAAHQEPTLSRYAAPVRQAHATVNPSAYLRLGLLGIGALVILALIAFGIRAVYRATTRTAAPVESTNEVMPSPAAVPSAVTQEVAAPTAASAKADVSKPKAADKTARTPLKVPSLYID